MKFSTRDITLAAFYVAITIATKYILGFVPGVQVTTFMTLIVALTLPLPFALLTNASSILLIGTIYGFGTWWIVYWPMFLIPALLTWPLQKLFKKYVWLFAVWCGLWALSIFMWYFTSDWIMFGKGYAISRVGTGALTNLVDMSSNFFIAILATEPIMKLTNNFRNKSSDIYH